ncbi:hypothetical protein CDD81_6504 [Ophiocordyceps australis]|uniref:Uncharacterized protein n=1 Tax=Ophiocordyceps australis TaxID=1399860 RepID=A0A2C5YD70_9HYPO|nr:hypothetical protein CDD81_6504 [Ophiocordyceps australis]
MRLAFIDRVSEIDQLQMLLPKSLLNSKGGGLNIQVKCGNDITDSPPVDYNTWKNTKGNKFTSKEAEARALIDNIIQSTKKVKDANNKVNEAQSPEQVEAALSEARISLDEAKEKTEKLGKFIVDVGAIQRLASIEGVKKVCKECLMDHRLFKLGTDAYQEARQEYATSSIRAGEKTLSLVQHTSSDKADAKDEALKKLASRLESDLDSKLKNKQLIETELAAYQANADERVKNPSVTPPPPPASDAANIIVSTNGRAEGLENELATINKELSVLEKPSRELAERAKNAIGRGADNEDKEGSANGPEDSRCHTKTNLGSKLDKERDTRLHKKPGYHFRKRIGCKEVD